MTLDERVAEAAANAKENGYTFGSVEVMAVDMATYCSDLESDLIVDIEKSITKQGLLS